MICVLGLVLVGWVGKVIYSLYFSPLKDLPSPFIFQVFPLYFEVLVGLGLSPQKLSDYHRVYGTVFRTGWRRVLVVSADGAKQIYSGDRFLKSRLYSGFGYLGTNLLSERDPVKHRERKRAISAAFTTGSLNEMEATVISVGLIPLLSNLRAQSSINLCRQLNYMVWDVMGELALGGSFNLLQDGHHPAMDWLANVTSAAQLAYLFPFLKYFRTKSATAFHTFTQQLLTKPNVCAPIRLALSKLPPEYILAESQLMLIGGTDTTSNGITFLIHLLITHPQALDEVVREIDSLPDGLITYKQCLSLPKLVAAVKETLRLLPPVAGTALRIVPEGGWEIHGYRIPAGTEVGVPTFALHRSPKIWRDPDRFQPERWFETKLDAAAGSFIPFLMGPTACIGKGLAWMEILVVSANLLRQFRFRPTHDLLNLTCTPTLRPRNLRYWVTVEPRQL